MIKNISIKNYKSLSKVHLPLGRINVFIGENGAGKSNILEAIALTGAATAGKLDNEFLASRGIRVAQPRLMKSAFSDERVNEPIEIEVQDDSNPSMIYEITNSDGPYSNWSFTAKRGGGASTPNDQIDSSMRISYSEFRKVIEEIILKRKDEFEIKKSVAEFSDALVAAAKKTKPTKIRNHPRKNVELEFSLSSDNIIGSILMDYGKSVSSQRTCHYENMGSFVIFSPENTSLRTFEREGQIEPLGVNGEGLFKLLTVLSEMDHEDKIKEINQNLRVFGWFDGFSVVQESGSQPGSLNIIDRFLRADIRSFDQRSANEGFLFLLFYFSLFGTTITPKFFAVDNVDASLNPKLCQKLIRQLTKLAVKYDKQALLTTHNPAILDGIDLRDPDQRLFVVSRNTKGETKVRRIEQKPKAEGTLPTRLSEAFLNGALGGLPKGF